MTTAYNLRNAMLQSGIADRQLVKDPGDGNTITVEVDNGVCICEGGSTRVLQDATQLPAGTKLTVFSRTSSITFSTVDPSNVALADGEWALFMVTETSDSVNQWSEVSSSNVVDNAVSGAAANDALPYDAGTYEFLATETAADAVAGILAIVSALDADGLIDGSGITQAV